MKSTLRKGTPEYGPTYMVTFQVKFTVSSARIATALLRNWASGFAVSPDKVPIREELETFLRKVAACYGEEAFYPSASFGDDDWDPDWNIRLDWALTSIRSVFPEMDDAELEAFDKEWRVS